MALSKKCRHGKNGWSGCRCAWYWDGLVDGRRTFINVGPDRAQARATAARIEADRLGGVVRKAPKDRRLEAVVERWLVDLEDRGRRRQTLLSYRNMANRVVDWFGAGTDMQRIDASAIAEFEADAFASRQGTGGRMLAQCLTNILNHAHREGLVDAVPRPPRQTRSVRPNDASRMTEAEVAATLAQIPAGRLRDMAEFAVLTGLRIGEVRALRAEDVDLERGTIFVRHSAQQRGSDPERLFAPTKTGHSVRKFRPDPVALALVEAQGVSEGRIWPISYDAARRSLTKAMKAAGVYRDGRGWHSLRHLNAALRDRAGQGIRQAGAELGHGPNFAMTASYGWADEAAPAAPVAAARRH